MGVLMNRIKYILLALGVIGSFGTAALAANSVAAWGANDPYQCNVKVNNVKINANSPLCQDKGKTVNGTITTTINLVLYFLGAISVLVIIFAGILYALSGGDANSVTKAKNTLLYAVIGLIVAMLAYAIVNFVLTTFN
jgi:Type IV secretion system pilin